MAQAVQARGVVLAGLVVAYAAAVLAAVLITRSITKPIGHLVRFTESIAEGNLAQRLEVKGLDEKDSQQRQRCVMDCDMAELECRGGHIVSADRCLQQLRKPAHN